MKTTKEIIAMLVESLGEEKFLELNDYLFEKGVERKSHEFADAVQDKACEPNYLTVPDFLACTPCRIKP